ncbi:Fc.00g091130.m01.CDS01 [Cosmosporella sp. VM-42]
MTKGVVHGTAEPPTIMAPAAEHDGIRGRKRDRSVTRSSVRTIRCPPSEDASTLRGRSRHRATSPWGYTSRAASPSVNSPNRKRLLHARLRREHCPSRVATPAQEQIRRRQRTRSRSRGPQFDHEVEASRAGDALSGLRNEVLADHEEENEELEKS